MMMALVCHNIRDFKAAKKLKKLDCVHISLANLYLTGFSKRSYSN